MIKRFNVGDVVIALPSSNERYCNTRHERAWRGIVTAVSDDTYYFDAKTVGSTYPADLGTVFTALSPEYFDVVSKVDDDSFDIHDDEISMLL